MVVSDIDQSQVTAGLLNAGVDLGPEKLTANKLKSLNEQQDARSEPGELPQFGSRGSLLRGGRNFSGAASVAGGSRTGGSRAMATRSSRLITSGGSRRQSSFLASHRSKMSADVTAQAESKFSALMELMTSASREASSFKEYWMALMADRESFDREREELMIQIEEYSEKLEAKDDQHENRHRELGDKNNEIEKLLAIINVNKQTTHDHERKLAERDAEIERVRRDFTTLQTSFSSLQFHHDTYKSDLEARNSQLRDREAERDSAIHDADKQRSEYRNLARINSDLNAKVQDLISQLETAHKEIATLTDRLRVLEHERSELLYEKDRLQDEVKRANARHDETTRELHDLTERYNTFQREANKTKDLLRTAELERDEHSTTIERLRYEIKDKTARLGDVETHNTDLSLRLEQSKREVTTTNEKLSHVTIEIQTLKTQLDDKHDQLRLIVVERDNLKDDVETERRSVLDVQRQVSNLQDQVSRSETTISELRTESLRLTETIRETERSRDEARGRHGPFEKEISLLKEKLSLALAQTGEVIDARDHARRECEEYRQQWEQVEERYERYGGESEELRWEIESLRTLLTEAREQKERAIAARNSADRERDEHIALWEAKCRELERFEEQKISQIQAMAKSSAESGHRQSGGSRVFSSRSVMHSGGGGHSSSAYGGGGENMSSIGSVLHHHHGNGTGETTKTEEE